MSAVAPTILFPPRILFLPREHSPAAEKQAGVRLVIAGRREDRLASPEAQTALVGQGLMVLEKGPEAAPAFFQAELVKHQKLVKQSGATLD